MNLLKTSSLPANLVDRMVNGDASARNEFLAYMDNRVHLLAREILDRNFPRMRHVTDSRSVANRTLLRLLNAERLNLHTPSVEGFIKYCARAVHNVLRDIARHKKRHPGDFGVGPPKETASGASPMNELSGPGLSPSKHLEANEVLEHANRLPDDLKDVVQLHGLLGLAQSDVAKVLALHPKEVSRRWNAALSALRTSVSP